MYENCLSILPHSIGQLTNLEEVLSLLGCEVVHVPEAVMGNFAAVTLGSAHPRPFFRRPLVPLFFRSCGDTLLPH